MASHPHVGKLIKSPVFLLLPLLALSNGECLAEWKLQKKSADLHMHVHLLQGPNPLGYW
jgi:hypothetical protein